jgi:hypothetical protein
MMTIPKSIVFLSTVFFGSDALANGAIVSCDFSRMCDGSGVCSDTDLPVKFTVFELRTGETVVEGGEFTKDVRPYIGTDFVTFTEWLQNGAINTVIVDADGSSVYSKYAAESDTALVPSHFYGSCTTEETK